MNAWAATQYFQINTSRTTIIMWRTIQTPHQHLLVLSKILFQLLRCFVEKQM